MKTVQIPESLFLDLCRYHLQDDLESWEIDDLARSIDSGLQDKLDALARRELYSKYKNTNLSDEERQAARIAYLDARGIRDSYRWSSLNPPE